VIKKTRVLHIGKYYYPYHGGFEASLHTLVNGLKDKLQIYVLSSNTQPKTVLEKTDRAIIIRLANFGILFSQPVTLTLPFWLRRIRADIIHLHLPNPLAVIFYLLVSPKAKLVVSYHNDVIRQRMFMYFLNPLVNRVLERAQVIVATSQNMIDNSRILKRFSDKCCVIPHGIDTERFSDNCSYAKKADAIRNSVKGPVLLFVGRLVYYKGLEYLIRAMKNIDAGLVIVGNGPYKKRLRLLAKTCAVEHKIFWEGEVSDELLPAYYHACDLFVLPSCAESESFGLVILEAHAAGKPVISTDLPTGVTFTNLHQNTGLVVPPRDSEALAENIRALLDSAGLRRKYGESGRMRVEREFVKEIMTERFLTLYNAINNN
jgi:rhamnosyl/mannosyltransferase